MDRIVNDIKFVRLFRKNALNLPSHYLRLHCAVSMQLHLIIRSLVTLYSSRLHCTVSSYIIIVSSYIIRSLVALYDSWLHYLIIQSPVTLYSPDYIMRSRLHYMVLGSLLSCIHTYMRVLTLTPVFILPFIFGLCPNILI